MKLENTSKKYYLTLEEMIEKLKTNSAYSIWFLDGVFCLINEEEDGEIIGETKKIKIHELKIKEEYYKAILDGNKTFELRKNDRDYQVGDLIQFTDARFKPKEYSENMSEKYYPHPSETLFKITYVLKDVPEYGLDKDYCILGIKRVEVKEVK